MSAKRAGFVYVLTSSGLPGHCKIGRTTQSVSKRIRQLEREYGLTHSFTEVSRHMVSDCVAVETATHRILRACRVPKSEMFECDVFSAQRAIRKAAILTLERPWYHRLWHWLILPRPERALKRWRRTRQRSSGWLWLVIPAVAILISVVLMRCKPDLPDWLPAPVQHTASLLESLSRAQGNSN